MDVDNDEEAFASTSVLGLSSILASVGVDASSLSSFFDQEGGGGSSSRRFAEIEAEGEDEDKYEDDVSEGSLPEEDQEAKEQREREQAARKAEEDRMYRRAMTMMQNSSSQSNKEGSSRISGAEAVMDRKGKSVKIEEVEKGILGIWPNFEKGKLLKMSEIFYETPADKAEYERELLKRKRRKIVPKEYVVSVARRNHLPETTSFLLPTLPELRTAHAQQPKYLVPIGSMFDREWVKEARDYRRNIMTRPPAGISLDEDEGLNGFEGGSFGKENLNRDQKKYMFELDEWETNIVMSTLDENKPQKPTSNILAPRNDFVENGDWLKDVIWDARRVSPDLVEAKDDDTDGQAFITSTDVEPDPSEVKAASRLDPFNLSNDHLYEHTRASRFRIRQTFGAIEVFHSYPAKTLQLPFYKTSLSKAESRAWHRPPLQFPTGVVFTFSKLKSNPSMTSKKKQRLNDPSELFKTTKDLSLSEKGTFVLLEFSEEYPPIMSSYGMGTTLVNYYRKKNDKDDTVPNPSILGVGDAEPFLLGYVDPGKVTQVIHNNLLRAPIFRHTPETSDFLVIRQTIHGHATYYLREIKNIFCVGQTVPNESEVPGPHARKNTNTAKMRLQIIAWLLMQKNKQKRVRISRLLKYFPDQNELQIRQRLKVKGNEFLIYDKNAGFHSGWWLLNPDYPWPTDRKEVVELVTPESAALFEAMQVGAQHLRDAGYTKTAEGSNEDDGDGAESNLDIEQQLAVWSTTLNYKKAEAQKAWLVVHGEGDPTGRGEGFSFLKTNMKNYFLRRGETEEGRRLEAEAKADGGPVKISNAEQGRIYEEEKRKVWDLQAKALSNPIPPSLTADDETYATSGTPASGALRFQRHDSRRPFSRAGSMAAGTPMFGESPMEDARSPSAMSGDEGSTFTGNDRGANKVLRITRVVKGKQQVEIVRDPAVIQSYLRRVEERKLAQYTDELENLKPTGNAEEDDLKIQALRQEVLRLKKNQHRRAQRKKYSTKGELPDVGDNIEGKRRCGACGAYGHTKANRNCPKFKESNVGPSPSATPNMPTPYGYGAVDTPGSITIDAPSPAPAPMKIKFALGGAGR